MKRTYSTRYPIWTIAEEQVLFDNYPRFGAPVCAQALAALGYQRKTRAVSQKARALGLQFHGEPTGRFRRGQQAWNAGLHYEPGGNSAAHRFKPGRIPHNGGKPIGAETIRDGYLYVKVANPNTWKQKHILVWQSAHGPAPKGHCITFRDGNPLNCNLENLELITRAQLATRNRWLHQPSAYSLINDRPARITLRKQGFTALQIRQNPALLEAERIKTMLKIQKRRRHAQPEK